jgi:rhodanese-related sulfurtransferase
MPSKDELVAHFSSRLAFETDASDVNADMDASKEFVLVDVRGGSSWDQGRAKGAIHMPHSEIAERALKEIPLDTPVVVYCWGPGCNGAHKGALNFALLGYQVKEMIGGFEYWAREGYPVVNNDGAVIREKDPLTAPVNSTSCDCG